MVVEKILYTDNLRNGTDKINAAIDLSNASKDESASAKTTADGAVVIADNAVIIANTADSKSDSTQLQLDNIVINSGTSDAETIQARETFPLLKDRLNSTDQQLADKVELIDFNKLRQGSIPYGLVKLPSDFTTIPFNLYRDFDGRMKHDYDLAQFEIGEKVIYIDRTYGNDTTGDGTTGLPYKFIKKAFEVARDSVETNIVVKVKRWDPYFTDKAFYYRDEGTQGVILTNKRVSIVPDVGVKEINITSAQLLSFTADENVWKATRSGVYGTINLNDRDFYDIPKLFRMATSLAECKTIGNSWYTDNVSVWVNTGSAGAPSPATNGISVLVNVPNFSVTLVNSTLYLKDINFLIARNGNAVEITGDINSIFIHNNCKFPYANFNAIGTVNANGLRTSNVGKTFGFGSVSAYTYNDGFNYHFYDIPVINRKDCLVFEYQCVGYENGTNNILEPVNNNVTTAHEGVNTLRVDPIGFRAKGPVCADAGGCYSIIYDGHMRDSIATSGSAVKSAYYFYNPDAGYLGAPAKAILINCDGGGEDTYSCNAGDGIVVTLQAFRGFNFPNTFIPVIKS